jgi:hypothetical protein
VDYSSVRAVVRLWSMLGGEGVVRQRLRSGLRQAGQISGLCDLHLGAVSWFTLWMSPRRVDPTETASIEALRTENQALRVENQLLRDEIARLKGLPPRPPVKPRQSSGMETATDPLRPKHGKGRRQTRGPKRDSDRVIRDVIVTAEVPEGSRFKGYETLLVRDLALSAEVLRYRRERWVTPAGEPVVAPVPTGIVGGYGANLRRFCLVLHARGR